MASKKGGRILNLPSIIAILLVAIAIPLTLLVLKNQQDLRQRAAGDLIAGMVYSDTNSNKTKDSNETGLASVKLEVYYFATSSAESSPTPTASPSSMQSRFKNMWGNRSWNNNINGRNDRNFSLSTFKKAEITTDSEGNFSYK